MIKCKYCEEEATMDSPTNLCLHHWKIWSYQHIFSDMTEEFFQQGNPTKEEWKYWKIIKAPGFTPVLNRKGNP